MSNIYILNILLKKTTIVRGIAIILSLYTQSLVARNYTPILSILLTYFLFSIEKKKIHPFFLNLLCSCPYSINLMLTATCMCRPYITLANGY